MRPVSKYKQVSYEVRGRYLPHVCHQLAYLLTIQVSAADPNPNPNPDPTPNPNPNPNQVMGGMMLLALHGPGGISLDQGAKKSI